MVMILMWTVVLVSLAGTVLNIYKRRSGFLCWALANSGIIYRNLSIGEYPQALLFAVYLVLAIWGWFVWSKNDEA